MCALLEIAKYNYLAALKLINFIIKEEMLDESCDLNAGFISEVFDEIIEEFDDEEKNEHTALIENITNIFDDD